MAMTYNEPCEWCGQVPTEHNRDIYYACDEHELELLELMEE